MDSEELFQQMLDELKEIKERLSDIGDRIGIIEYEERDEYGSTMTRHKSPLIAILEKLDEISEKLDRIIEKL